MNKTILDTFLSDYPVQCTPHSVTVSEDELVHVVGAQEPVRDQPDERMRALLREGWLTIESLQPDLTEAERKSLVEKVQQAARTWLNHPPTEASPADIQQIRWIVEKTRSHESKQQIAHRVWLTLVVHGQGNRGIEFSAEGRVQWDEGITGRIGIAPDALLDLIWAHNSHTIYATSFRTPDGTVTRGKGRHRWYVYRLNINPNVDPLFARKAQKVTETVALIIASETYATQPQLPRDFYGGDEFQQACIDAQDQQFDHMLVLSPQHGVISLDDIVPSDKAWDDVLEQHIWPWQMLAVQRLGLYLSEAPALPEELQHDLNWWLWINPNSTFVFTVFGGGFAVRVLFDHLLRARTRSPHLWPYITLEEYRQGYIVGDFDNDLEFDYETEDDVSEDMAFELAMQDINQLLDWATDFVSLVSINVPPTEEVWEIAPDEALIPIRLLADTDVDVENLLDLLTDITLLLEQPLPFSLLVNPELAVSALLQLTHNIVHNEHDMVQEIISVLPDNILRQYVEKALQEPSQEDRLCACLTLAEQIQIISLTLPHDVTEQLLIWMQTYISGRIRQQLLGDDQQSPQ